MIMGYSCSAYFLIVIKFSLSSFINALKNDNYDELIPLLRRYSELITSRNNSDNNSKQTEIMEAIYDLKDISDYESILQILNKLNEKYKNTEFYFLLNKISSVSEYGYSFIGNISEPISLIKIKKYISKPYSNKEEEERFKPFTNCVEHEITFLLHLNAG